MAGGLRHRQLRVFVSSTFKDMQSERSLLVGKVFPMVAEYCHRLKLEFIGVDLLWGITEEQSRRGETVEICMAEIDRSRPLFIGIVGERYGWVPEGSPVSVTEQEILYGALEAPADTEAFFYLRDPALTEKKCGPFEPDARLDSLKARIRASRYPVMDGYGDLDSFGLRVYEDLTGLADRMAAQEDADPVTKERLEQVFMAEQAAANYVDRPEPMARLEEYAKQGGLTVITGEPGAGKTAILSSWILGRPEKDGEFSFLCFLGSLPAAGWEEPGRRLVEELLRHFSLEYPRPADKEGLRRAIHILLNMAAKKGRVVLAFDQIDALPLDDGFGLSWLPEELPEGVTVVVTAGDGDALDRLRLRAHRELRLERLSRDEVSHVAQRYLADYSKTLGRPHLEMLQQAESARNPLYLITLLNELRHIGQHERLTEQLGGYLACGDLRTLFGRVLSRIDRDYGEAETGLPRRMFSLLEASRGGLTEGELVSLLGNIPQARFAPLRIALEPFTAVNGGAIHIAVPEFRQAVCRHYGFGEAEALECRRELAAWFAAHRDTPRRGYVLPWLLLKTEDYSSLFSLLSEQAAALEIWRRNRNELKEYWAALGTAGYSPADGCRSALDAPEKNDAGYLLAMGELLAETGGIREAEKLLAYLAGENSPAGLQQKDAACGVLGNICQREGRFREAEEFYRKKLAFAKKRGDRYEQQRALGNIGLISLILGEPAAAQAAFEDVLALASALNQRDSQQVALGNLGNVAFSMGDMEKAGELYERQRAVCRDSGNIAGLINACGALGILYGRKKEYESAEREFRMQEEYSRRIGAADGLSNALGNRAALAAGQGNRAAAERLFLEKLELCRKTGQFLGEQNALGNLSALAWERGDCSAALGYAEKRVEITRNHRAFRQYAEALFRLSVAERQLGREESAGLHRLQAETVAKQHGFTGLLEQIKKQNQEEGA